MVQSVETISKCRNLILEDWNSYKKVLLSAVSSDNHLLNLMNDYVLTNMGKGIRPLLALLAARTCAGEVNEVALHVAAATEIIHNATLFHDDVVDESDVRRGKKTIRSLFSPGSSVLFGDYWLSRAIGLLIGLKCDFRIYELFTRTIQDLATGEMIQMERANDLKTTFEDYYRIISGKTASLFVTALQSSAIASRASAGDTAVITEYARQLGYSFQVRDDILDYATQAEIGKDVDSDLYERKITPPLLGAFVHAPARKAYILDLMSRIDVLQNDKQKNAAIVAEIKRFVYDNHGLEYAHDVLQKHIQNAVSSLSRLGDSVYRSALAELALSLNLK